MADKTLLGNLTNGESDCNIKKKRKKYALLAQMLLTQLVYSAIIQNCVAMPTRLPGGATMFEELKTAKKVVGVKQLRRALNDHLARTVFLACDADPALTEPRRLIGRVLHIADPCVNSDRPAAFPSARQPRRFCADAVISGPNGISLIFRDIIKAGYPAHHLRKEENTVCLLLTSW